MYQIISKILKKISVVLTAVNKKIERRAQLHERAKNKTGIYSDTLYVTVKSSGMTGKQWAEKYPDCSPLALKILNSESFKETTDVEYDVAIIQRDLLNKGTSTIVEMMDEGMSRGWKKLDLEVACLLRDRYSRQELLDLGLMWVITMHEPVDTEFGKRLLYSCRDCGGPIHACFAESHDAWGKGAGFAFGV